MSGCKGMMGRLWLRMLQALTKSVQECLRQKARLLCVWVCTRMCASTLVLLRVYVSASVCVCVCFILEARHVASVRVVAAGRRV